MTEERDRMWVHPDFKKRMKKVAVDENISVLQLTERLGKDESLNIGRAIDETKKKRPFDFRW